MFLLPADWYTVRRVSNKGRGVFARHDIPAGTVIGDYMGKIMKIDTEDELADGLYTMWSNNVCDILADPKTVGVHLLNHSCANNCDVFPYQGHMLYFASRKIFKGEEMTVTYALTPCESRELPCALHQCFCDTTVCMGTMHQPDGSNPDQWERFVRKQHGKYYYQKLGPFGSQLPPLKKYPARVKWYPLYDVYGSEKKPALRQTGRSLPSLATLKREIRKSGQRLVFPALHLEVYGLRDDILLGKRV